MAGVLYKEGMGVYLGSFMGLGLWSEWDPAGQPAACTFDNEEQAMEIMKQWDTKPENVKFVEVPYTEGGYAPMAACVEAGLPEWEIERY
jgi:hypothetical protein